MSVHTHCRICQSPLPEPFLDLGNMPLANAFLSSLEEVAIERSYPLAVTACNRCGLVQLNYVVPAEQLYRTYIYFSSTSDAVKRHAAWLSAELMQRYGWDRSRLLVEVASNDGTVLKFFQQIGLRVLGVEPAVNVATAAKAAGVPTLEDFFNTTTAKEIATRYGQATCILGRHVFAHVNNLDDFLDGVCTLLADDGVFIIEVPYLGDLLSDLEFDTIYHEHLSYFALKPIVRLCATHGLHLVDVDRVRLHGGSMILHMCRAGSSRVASQRLTQMLAQEEMLALDTPETLHRFGTAVRAWRDQCAGLIAELQRSGARLVGYGAAAKGNTLLNYCPPAASALECILDRSPHKQGLYTPGTHILVKPPAYWAESGATHIVILAWNFREEIMRQMDLFAQHGGRFVVPIPEPKVISRGFDSAPIPAFAKSTKKSGTF